MFDLKETNKQLAVGQNLEEVLQGVKWNEFEEFVAEVLKENSFKTKNNFRFKTNKRFEIDVVASRGNLILLVDCKNWSAGRKKDYGLRQAAAKQSLRTEEFKRFLKKNPIAQSQLSVSTNSRCVPVIVTLRPENISRENETLIVSAFQLNSFLVNNENYI